GASLRARRRVEAFSLLLPEGEVLPLPHDAFVRLAHLALLELPFAAEAGVEGRMPFDAEARAAPPSSRPRSESARLAKIHPLPGGVRRYKATLDALLAWIGRASPPAAAFRAHLEQQYGAPGAVSAEAALRLLEGAGLVARRGDDLALTETGR